MINSVTIDISAYSDLEKVEENKPRWGDYWFKEHLKNTFRELGCTFDDHNPFVLLHLFGHPLKHIPLHRYKILWIHSHPDWITSEILKSYHKVYCISKAFTEQIIKEVLQIDIQWLPYPTHMIPLKGEKCYDVVFVGNNRRDKKGRKIINDLVSLAPLPFKINIWGLGWEGLIPPQWHGGDYFDHRQLNELYAASKIVLNDHHDDMRQEGFINPRILDTLASGSFVITDALFRINDIITTHIPVYHTEEELKKLLIYYLTHDQERDKLIKKAQPEALTYTYERVCTMILEDMKKWYIVSEKKTHN